jgi:TfoX/Sxy family transcriptional regulator of competence genes
MAHKPPELQKRVEAAAPLELDLRFKPMFGGISVYAHGTMCISLSDVGLALKLGEADREVLLALKGAKPLQYEPDAPVSKTYVVVPDAMLSDPKKLRGWIEKSAAFVKGSGGKSKAAAKSGRKPARKTKA